MEGFRETRKSSYQEKNSGYYGEETDVFYSGNDDRIADFCRAGVCCIAGNFGRRLVFKISVISFKQRYMRGGVESGGRLFCCYKQL